MFTGVQHWALRSISERCTKPPRDYWKIRIDMHKFLWCPLNKSSKTRKQDAFFFLYFDFSSLLHIFFLREKTKEGWGKGKWKETIRTVRTMRELFSVNSTIISIAFLWNRLSKNLTCQVFRPHIFSLRSWAILLKFLELQSQTNKTPY